MKIQTPNTPERLVLAWEAPKLSADRSRWAIGELINEAFGAEFRYYHGQEFTAKNCGREYQRLLDDGYEGFPGFYPHSRTQSFRTDVVEAFRRRLPPQRRSDFKQYLEHYGLDATPEISDMALLGITGARLPSDGFELIDPLTTTGDRFEVVLQIAGYGHYLSQAEGAQVGARLSIDLEPENKFDPNAIAFRFSGQTIGYVNRLQVEGLKRLLAEKSIEAFIMRLNGTQSSPRAYAFLRVSSDGQKKEAA
jgi:hypothetical protein